MSDTTETAFYRYPPRRLVGDYVRAGGGTAFGLGVLATAEPSTGLLLIFGGMAALFGAFGVRTVAQHVQQVAVNETGVFTRGLRSHKLEWQDLREVRLRYFGSRRQRHQNVGGFMQLTLRGTNTKMKFESNLQGFQDIVQRAVRAAGKAELSLDPTTAENLLGLGIDVESERQPTPTGDEP